jgi:SAM-dependent methyltransferase
VSRSLAAQDFDPGPLGALVNPFYLARRGLARALRVLAPEVGGRLLDVGCGTQPYRTMFATERYVGLELDSPANRALKRADAFYDGATFPFPDASFDTVLCNQVLEHVFEPHAFLAECTRVLAPGGRLLLSVPFVWDEHEQPRDYARYSSYGLRHLAARHDLRVLAALKTGADASILFQLANAYLFKLAARWPRLLRYLLMLTVMAPINLLGLMATLSPRNEDLYLDNVLLLEKPRAGAAARAE